VTIFWRDAMSVGVAELDADHKKLIALLNHAEKAVAQSDHNILRVVLQELVAYVDYHFRREEAVLRAVEFPTFAEHKKAHEQMAQKAILVRDKYLSATTPDEKAKYAAVVPRLLNDWLINHIFKEDMKLKPYARIMIKRDDPGAGLEAVSAPPKRVEKNKDIEYKVPPHLEHLLKRIEYVAPEPPPATGDFKSFDDLCAAAVNQRIDRVLVFFQRRNPGVERKLPPVFLASDEFAKKFHLAVAKFIVPAIKESRQVRLLATNFDWASADSESFWDFVTPQLKDNILETWMHAWDEMKLVEVRKEDGTRVLQVKEPTKQLREMLAPSTPEAYDLPRVSNREIEVFKSLLDPVNDWWGRLNLVWQTCHDLYEQEKDPRVFQQQAREGALRDGLLNAFTNFPEKWGDFLVLTCHRVFPRVTTQFLESFSRNIGRNEAEREGYMPYLIRYLRQAREDPGIARREEELENLWMAQEKELRTFLKNNPPQ